MKRIILAAGLFLLSLATFAQSIPEPVIGVSFDEMGAVLSGSDASNHSAKSYNLSAARTVYDPIKDCYYGVTNYDASGYFYVTYDADDALGKTFGNEVTWEFLFRLDNLKGNASATTSTKKVFSSQQSGGWGIMHTSGTGLRFEYVTEGNKINHVKPKEDNIVTGKFYHVVVTVNKPKKVSSIYINNVCVAKDVSLPADDYIFGNFGTTRRSKNMWFCLGGDPAGSDKPSACEYSARATYVYANIYGKSLSAADVSTLYNKEDTKYYTEPQRPQANNDLILDAVFGENGTAADKSPYKAELGVNRYPATQYNAAQHRYEGTCKTNTAFNFFYRDYFYDPSISSQLGTAHSFEVYCRNNGVFTDHMCPLSNQQDGGFGILFSKTNGYPGIITNGAGYHASTSSQDAGLGIIYDSKTYGTGYNHYVYVYDRIAHTAKLYVNGQLKLNKSFDAGDNLCFPFAAYQWLGIMADTRALADHSCNDFPLNGDMSIARVWGKALSDTEISGLYKQAQATSANITIDASGIAGLCLPFAALVPAGMKAYVPISKEGNKVTMAQLADEGQVVGYGTPFFLKGTAGNHEIQAADLSASKAIYTDNNLLEGSFIAKSVKSYKVQLSGSSYTGTFDGSIIYPSQSAFLPYDGINSTLEFILSDSVIINKEPEVVPDTVTGDNIYGRVTCNGMGMEGIKVSDGFITVKTDKDGKYTFRSEKANGYVFYTIPSGYMPYQDEKTKMEDKIFVPFWQALTSTKIGIAEEHNFELQPVNNDEFFFLAGADSHLANRYNDVTQFEAGYIRRVKEEKAAADAASVPIYSTVLGDNAWDGYWYSNGYGLEDVRKEYVACDYPMPFFPCMGNHDNDGATLGGLETTDFQAAWSWRKNMAPNYYSYNLGQIHFVVLDDIYYLNTGSASGTGCVGSRNYKGYIPPYQFEWLKKDLEDVDEDTPVFICVHIPVWMRSTSQLESCTAYTTYSEIGANSAVDLAEIVKKFKTVHIISGHTHYNYHAHPENYPNIHENNIAAICAIWWYSGYKTGWHNCRDGVPGGYEMFHIKGKDIKYKYHSIEYNGNAQFHALDVNTVKKYYQDNDMATFISKHSSYAYTDFGKWDDNQILINVFSLDNDWKVEVEEDGQPRTAVRIYEEDPYHMLTYDIPWYKGGSSIGKDARSTKNTHMFKVQCQTATSPVKIRVTDSFGEVYEQTMKRPVAFDLSAIDTTNTIVTGIHTAKVPVKPGSAEIYASSGSVKIMAAEATTAQIISLDGSSRNVSINSGSNVVPVSTRGIYVVKVGNTTKKIYVK